MAVPARPGSAADAPRCAALLAALPDEIDPGVARRPVEGDREAAVWGDPPVVLRCGVTGATPQLPVGVNGVDWEVRDSGPGFTWTSIGLVVNVSVDIPDAYANGAELVNPLAAPMLATLR